MTVEIWKPIIGYEDVYEISSLGRIKNIKRNIIRKQNIDRGYKRLILTKNYKQ